MSFTTVPMRFDGTPLLWQVENVCSVAERRALVSRIESWSPTIATNNPIHRNQDRVMRDDPELSAELFARLRAHLPERIGALSLVGLNERLRF